VESGVRDDIEARLNDLTRASHKLAEVLYKQTGAPQGSPEQEPEPQAPPQDTGDGSVIDAEYEDVNKNK
jgi:molecular chaperone DnaK